MCLVRRYSVSGTDQNHGYRLRCLKSTPGCTDLEACNYESAANEDDGSCDYSCQNYVDPSGNGPCAGETTYSFNGEEYGLTEIGDLCWFRHNLARRHLPTAMTFRCSRVLPWNNAGSDSIAAYRMYGDDTFYSDQYGLHYNGWAARDDRGLCPSGFAVPVKANFENLLANASENQLVAASGWDNESWNGNNASGFTLIPSGYISSGAWVVRYLCGHNRAQHLSETRIGSCDVMVMVRLIELSEITCWLLHPCVSAVEGCMDTDACNYNASANTDNGSCDYSCQSFVDPKRQRPVSRRNSSDVPRPQLSAGGSRKPMLVRRKPPVNGLCQWRCDYRANRC